MGASIPGPAAELVLPQNHNAFYCDERVELAVAGLADGEKADTELVPTEGGPTAVALPVEGDGSTVTLSLPGRSLAPGQYAVRVDDKDAAALQASELLLETVDEAYPGPGKALIQFVWSPFAVEKNVLFIGASDDGGLRRGAERLTQLAH